MAIRTHTKTGTHQEENPTVPEIMDAAAIDRFGGSKVLTTHKLPVPRSMSTRC